ncbi:hypothetical protein FOZ63_001163, partial [Perkinsus olseni]
DMRMCEGRKIGHENVYGSVDGGCELDPALLSLDVELMCPTDQWWLPNNSWRQAKATVWLLALILIDIMRVRAEPLAARTPNLCVMGIPLRMPDGMIDVYLFYLMFASPNPKFTATVRRRSSTGSPSLSELSPRMKQGIEAAVRRAKLARERRNSLALPPPVRRRSTLKGMLPVEAPPQAKAGGQRASQVAENGRKRRASSPAVEGEAGPPVVTMRGREMSRQSVTRPLATPELVSRMETWIDEIRAELLEVESELTEGPAPAGTDGVAGVTPRASLTTPRLRGAGILSRLLAVQETDGPSGVAEVTRSSSQSERSSPARSGATESVIADAPEPPESSVSPVSSSTSMTASPPMQPMSRVAPSLFYRCGGAMCLLSIGRGFNALSMQLMSCSIPVHCWPPSSVGDSDLIR